MTGKEQQKIEEVVVKIRIMLVSPEFGTSDHHTQLEDIADELSILAAGGSTTEPT